MSRTEDLASGYDVLYGEPHIAADADTPLTVLEDLRYHGANGRALDVGCGNGRNSLQLARAGFKVTAIDLSAVGIAKLQDSALTAGLEIETIVGDAETCLHLLLRPDCCRVRSAPSAENLRAGIDSQASSPHRRGRPPCDSGLQEGQQFRASRSSARRFLSRFGEIEDLYSGWNIVAHVDKHESALPHADANVMDYSIFLARMMNGPSDVTMD